MSSADANVAKPRWAARFGADLEGFFRDILRAGSAAWRRGGRWIRRFTPFPSSIQNGLSTAQPDFSSSSTSPLSRSLYIEILTASFYDYH